MEKRIIILLVTLISIASCNKDDDGDCVETITYVNDTAKWFSEVTDTTEGVIKEGEISAKSDDSLTETFLVDYHKAPHFNPATICEKIIGDDYIYIDYSASLHDIGFLVAVSGFGIDPKLEMVAGDKYIFSSYWNENDRVVYNFRTGKLNYGPQAADGSVRYIGDTVVNNKNYPDIYVVEGLAYPNADIKKMIFSVKRGVLIYQSYDADRVWVLDN